MSSKPRGLYLLALRLPVRAQTRVGSLGELSFPPGYYLYAGSARGRSVNLCSRICRHYRLWKSKQPKLRWHIDYLLILREVELTDILVLPGELELRECWIFDELSSRIPELEERRIRGFGSSDCSCKGHLLYVKEEEYRGIKELIESLGYREIDPSSCCWSKKS